MGVTTRCIFLFLFSVTSASNDNVFARLHSDLFKDANYEKDAIPMISPAGDDNDNAINLALGLSVISMDVSPRGVLSANTWLRTFWTDYRLKWNPADYQGVKSIRAPSSQLWKPDLSIYNAANVGCGSFEERLSSSPTLAIVYSTGDVLWMPPIPIDVNCNHDKVMVKTNDEIACNIRIGSWTYDGNHINLTSFGESDILDLNEMSSNTAFDVTSQKGDALATSHYPCCSEPYIAMDYQFTVKKTQSEDVKEEEESEESSKEDTEEIEEEEESSGENIEDENTIKESEK